MDIQQALIDYLQNKQEERKKRTRSGKISPSKLGWCYRNQYWYINNEPPTNPPTIESLKRMNVGTAYHNMIQEACDYDFEIEINTDKVHAYADLVSTDTVGEIKSISEYGWKELSKNDFDVLKYRPDYVLQLMTYVHLLNKQYGQLFLISKDYNNTFQCQYDIKDWKEKVCKEIETVWGILVKDELPPAKKSWMCKYCDWKTKCKGIEDATNSC